MAELRRARPMISSANAASGERHQPAPGTGSRFPRDLTGDVGVGILDRRDRAAPTAPQRQQRQQRDFVRILTRTATKIMPPMRLAHRAPQDRQRRILISAGLEIGNQEQHGAADVTLLAKSNACATFVPRRWGWKYRISRTTRNTCRRPFFGGMYCSTWSV